MREHKSKWEIIRLNASACSLQKQPLHVSISGRLVVLWMKSFTLLGHCFACKMARKQWNLHKFCISPAIFTWFSNLLQFDILFSVCTPTTSFIKSRFHFIFFNFSAIYLNCMQNDGKFIPGSPAHLSPKINRNWFKNIWAKCSDFICFDEKNRPSVRLSVLGKWIDGVHVQYKVARSFMHQMANLFKLNDAWNCRIGYLASLSLSLCVWVFFGVLLCSEEIWFDLFSFWRQTNDVKRTLIHIQINWPTTSAVCKSITEPQLFVHMAWNLFNLFICHGEHLL